MSEQPVSRWLSFADRQPSASGKTWEWIVRPKEDAGSLLGYVRWYGPWRCYTFAPIGRVVFEPTCLQDIAAFCSWATRNHREAAQARRQRIRLDAELSARQVQA